MQFLHRQSPARVPGIALLLALGILPAHAQVTQAQDPSLVMQEHLRRIEQASPQPPARVEPEAKAPRPVAPPTTATVRISEIEFSRSELLEPKDLQALGQRYVGRALGTADIQQLLDDIAGLYRARGILTAMPVLPRQDLNTGRMRILLVEGRLGAVRVESAQAADADWVRRWFDLEPNAVVRSEDLRQRLALFNNASDFAAQARFIAGEQFGQSELAIDVAPPDRVRGWAFYENTSASGGAQGQWLAAAGLRLSPATVRGGRLDAAAVLTDTSNTLTGSWSLPVGTQGWRTGLAATRSHTRTSLPDQGLRVEGTSSAFTWDVGRTWILQDPWLLSTGLSLGRFTSTNRFYIDPTPDPVTTQTGRTKLVANALLQHEGAAARGSLRATVTANLSSTRYGYGELAGSWLQAVDRAGHWLWRIGVVVRPVSSGPVSQLDQLQLGGGDTVRGFNTGAASGEKGAALQLELRHRLQAIAGAQAEAYAFVDAGVAGSSSARKHIESAGIGVQVRLPSGLGLDLLGSRQLSDAQGGRNRLLARLVSNW